MKSNMQPVVLGAVASTSDPNLDVLTATDPGCVVCDVKINDAKGLDDATHVFALAGPELG